MLQGRTKPARATAALLQISPTYRPKLEAQKTCDIIHLSSLG